ncbi:Sporulation related domain-containing protein [Polaribacter sp. KT25b]|uniref:SPOR domain-containing protein n=1 Tax=Polaribacter sp. KT25b TaxID=1855336 RepID=UPI00087D3910|nr:SPOR domain-containing protein [Polaribacter sp. KT25b]SDS43860.1 Sporulation related domain-containing protein [Polaribacter sp. KT25b]
MKNKLYLGTFILLLLASSNSISAQNTTNSSNQIKNLIAKKRAFNSKFGFGFRVQIFYGNETEARSLQNKFKLNFPDVYTKLDYDQPYWKVQVGNYKTRLEADKAMVGFSEKFSGLIVIPLGK